MFSLARQHVLLPDQPGLDPDRAAAMSSWPRSSPGNSFCAVDALSPADGFTQTVTSPAHATGAISNAGPGNAIAWQPAEVLHIRTPPAAGVPLIRVLRDGQEIARLESESSTCLSRGRADIALKAYLRQPGLTGWRRWTLWIFANPVYVTERTTENSYEVYRSS